jgi:catechol 2,3-dioxygenase-like lactoylglutathione lyase family enzyme
MPRGLDHIVHAVRDLDAAAELYRGLGFTVGARNRHPWGTHNHIIQFPGVFIELLTLAEPDKLDADGFSVLFAKYNDDFAKRGEGLSMLLLESKDARADEAAFRAAGIAASEGMRFEREAKRPDGSPVKVGFSLAFADDTLAPHIHFATCQQHFPENFWNPAFQKHANGVTGVAGVVAVAEDPARHLEFMQNFVGATGGRTGEGFTIATPRGSIEVTTPAAFEQRFGEPAPDVARGARLAALRFSGRDLAAGRHSVLGATLVFEANKPR